MKVMKYNLKTNKASIKVDPYTCAICVKDKYFDVTKTAGHIPRDFSQHLFFFIKKEKD